MKPWKRTRKGAQPGNYMIVDRASGDVCGEVLGLHGWWVDKADRAGAPGRVSRSLSLIGDRIHYRWLEARQ